MHVAIESLPWHSPAHPTYTCSEFPARNGPATGSQSLAYRDPHHRPYESLSFSSARKRPKKLSSRCAQYRQKTQDGLMWERTEREIPKLIPFSMHRHSLLTARGLSGLLFPLETSLI
mmetsp:Transcript_45250/g.63300  ORF Transcript_45250/g.63300 Transcript_45250/m.63300 type:complete len:117 (-) Transcript_45250:292-642(-)